MDWLWAASLLWFVALLWCNSLELQLDVNLQLASSLHQAILNDVLVQWHHYHQQLSVSFGFGHKPLRVLL